MLKFKKNKKISLYDYRVSAPESINHSCETVVLREANYITRKAIVNFLKYIGILSYDLVSFKKGSLIILDEEKEINRDIFETLRISKKLHNSKKIINFTFLNKDENIDFIKKLKKIKKILKKETKLKVENYFLKFSEDKKNIIFFKIVDSQTEEIFYWPYFYKKKEVLALRCMDFRFRGPTKAFLENIFNFDSYDLVSYPGAGKSIIEKKEKSLAFLSIKNAIEKKETPKVLIINHMDCGAYGGSKKFCNMKDEEEFMIGETRKTLIFLNNKFPRTEFTGLLEFFEEGNLRFKEIYI